MRFTGYFLAVILICSLGSLLNILVWYINDQLISEPSLSWNQDFSWYVGIFVFSVILSFVASFFILLIIWFVENLRKKFTLLVHLLFPFSMIGIFLTEKASLENYIHLCCFLLPGILGYYIFVYRKIPSGIDPELLDRF